ncbi:MULTISPECIES: FAD-dependent oxidoreductase [unclassified Saccharopolyspora]|uniref:NAD(P)/FAD-dependent oxidoreductase n=1 Tax=unclassified Saccharopolyspora TaxID=2646250 RepID=UPI001CD63C14|nr:MULTISPECIES: FAD-dependent oxidoreductase [unclassified Saccharopolyspora]MCA1188522.1 FAD-dependent oxidoreductase [Saccharopolyspora sp. 6T]MCA1194196.1 FAD-dependent oxidoreductase [Saccharopolyspora sp. 6V]MCA1228939.1 FAD-dependent oxidoreductase [Saccharopolyspora sp. 6M]MCA1278303.1 FAD-dependent oxidoreductase [Saccharopolyspora sp. 7B]
MSVLVVGASAAGLSTVEALRRAGHDGPVAVLGDEPHPPYDRPPLSKKVLAGEWEPDRVRLRTDEVLAGLDAEFVLGDAAVSLDAANRTARTASGRELGAERIVLATGVRPRTLPGHEGLTGVHVLRTVEDSLALRAELHPGARLVVVGEGVLGSEIAATARAAGLHVTLTGPLPTPMAGQLGPLVGGRLAALHAERGVELRLGHGVTGFTGHDRVTGVRLDSGDELPADVVVVAVGAVPNTGWLAGSGLRLDDGVVCDSRCRAAPGIYAVGDVCRWFDERTNSLLRLENRTHATEQAGVVAANVLGADRAYSPIPFFWTDQYDVKIQVHGTVRPAADAEVVDGDLADGRFVVRYREDGRTTGVLGWNMPKQTRLRRQEIVDAAAAAPAR